MHSERKGTSSNSSDAIFEFESIRGSPVHPFRIYALPNDIWAPSTTEQRPDVMAETCTNSRDTNVLAGLLTTVGSVVNTERSLELNAKAINQ